MFRIPPVELPRLTLLCAKVGHARRCNRLCAADAGSAFLSSDVLHGGRYSWVGVSKSWQAARDWCSSLGNQTLVTVFGDYHMGQLR
jgi:hypothetical protein